MERKLPFVEGQFYHLYNRGVEKRTIFTSASDYKRFMMLLYLANSAEDVRIANIIPYHSYEEILAMDRGSQLVSIGAFCLMPNHFHLLASPLVQGGVSKFMLKIQTGYSMYFNTKYNHTGSLFQGPFKSEHADEDGYLKYLFSYIHLNPAKLKDSKWKEHIGSKDKSLRRFVEKYPYSSLPEYLSGNYNILNPTSFPEYFSSQKEITAHVTDWLVKDQT